MDLQKIVYDSIDELNQQLDDDNKLKKSLDTKLFGGSSKLDSLGLINLIVNIEQNIEDEFDLSLTIADERACPIPIKKSLFPTSNNKWGL